MQKRSNIANFHNALGPFIPDLNYAKGEGVQNLIAVTSFSCKLITVRTRQNRSPGKQFIKLNMAESVNDFLTAQIKYNSSIFQWLQVKYAKARAVIRRVRVGKTFSEGNPSKIPLNPFNTIKISLFKVASYRSAIFQNRTAVYNKSLSGKRNAPAANGA